MVSHLLLISVIHVPCLPTSGTSSSLPISVRFKAPTHLADLPLAQIVGQFPPANSSRLRILNMFDRESRPTITESMVESADSAIESASFTTDSAADPVKIDLWILAFRSEMATNIFLEHLRTTFWDIIKIGAVLGAVLLLIE